MAWVVCAQETKVTAAAADTFKGWCHRPGWKCVLANAVRIDKGGLSAGTAVFAKQAIGLGVLEGGSAPCYGGRFAVAVVEIPGCPPLCCASVYSFSGCGSRFRLRLLLSFAFVLAPLFPVCSAAMAMVGTTSTSTCSLSSSCTFGICFGEVEVGVEPGPKLVGPDLVVDTVLGCAGAKTDRGPCAGVYTASSVDSSLFPGGFDAAKPALDPLCVGIGDCICICNLVSTGFPKKEKAYYVHHHHGNSMDHLGNVNKFWENVNKFGNPQGACTEAPFNSNMHDTKNSKNLNEKLNSNQKIHMHENHKSHSALGDHGGASPECDPEQNGSNKSLSNVHNVYKSPPCMHVCMHYDHAMYVSSEKYVYGYACMYVGKDFVDDLDATIAGGVCASTPPSRCALRWPARVEKAHKFFRGIEGIPTGTPSQVETPMGVPTEGSIDEPCSDMDPYPLQILAQGQGTKHFPIVRFFNGGGSAPPTVCLLGYIAPPFKDGTH